MNRNLRKAYEILAAVLLCFLLYLFGVMWGMKLAFDKHSGQDFQWGAAVFFALIPAIGSIAVIIFIRCATTDEDI